MLIPPYSLTPPLALPAAFLTPAAPGPVPVFGTVPPVLPPVLPLPKLPELEPDPVPELPSLPELEPPLPLEPELLLPPPLPPPPPDPFFSSGRAIEVLDRVSIGVVGTEEKSRAVGSTSVEVSVVVRSGWHEFSKGRTSVFNCRTCLSQRHESEQDEKRSRERSPSLHREGETMMMKHEDVEFLC
jgi:hypothetical protein